MMTERSTARNVALLVVVAVVLGLLAATIDPWWKFAIVIVVLALLVRAGQELWARRGCREKG